MEFRDLGVILNITGSHSSIILSGETKTIDYQAPYNFYLTGCDYEALGRNFGDRATFQVIHTATQAVLGQFATDIFVREKANYEFYKANIYVGLIIRIIYKNTGPNDVNFNLNLIAHKDK